MVDEGVFTIIDGLDGIGKGVIESELIKIIQQPVFDSIQWCKDNHGKRPGVELLGEYKGILASEPTYSLLGIDIRNYLTANKNKGVFSAEELIQAYSIDRHIQMAEFIVPALRVGCDVIQSRSFATTLCYQTLNSEDEGKNIEETKSQILNHPGNLYELENAPDLLIIPTIRDISELINRLSSRNKKDNTIFENEKFLRRAKPFYESDWLREIFEEAGSKVAYIDAGISIESSRSQAVDIYKHFLETGEVKEGHDSPIFQK